MLKKLLPLFAGLLLTLSVFAAGVVLKDDHPTTYTVVKGDTLWGIAERFLAKPWLWPEVWQANPQIENPHLIYPGDVINLVYVNGEPRLQLGGRGGVEPHVRATALDESIPPISLSAIKQFLRRPRLFSEKEYKHLPYVVAIEENQLRGVNGQFVYVRGLDAKPGQRYAIARPTVIYRDVPARYPWPDMPRKQTAEPLDEHMGVTVTSLWNEIEFQHTYWDHSEILGYELMEIGNGQITKVGDPSSLLVTYSDYEIKPGDRIVAIDEHPFDSQFVPHSPKQVPDNLRVLAFADALNAVGRNQVVALSRGARDGVENGQVYSIFTPGEQIRDRVKYADNDVRTVFSPNKDKVQLPEEYVGHVLVFRTFDRVSYGLIMDGIRPVHLYDMLHEPDHL